LHNTLFAQTGLPHHYTRLETAKVSDELRAALRAPDFGGASVTIPLKQDIEPLLDGIAADVQIIGALNTVVPEKTVDKAGKTVVKLIGRNTDWQGMVDVLHKTGAQGGNKVASGLVIGGGGTARAAIYALHSMEYTPIYLIGRSPEKMQKLASSFPEDYDLRVITSKAVDASIPSVAIGTIPAEHPLDSGMKEALSHIFEHGAEAPAAGSRILLEMAYKPRDTAVKLLAESKGWKTVDGLEVLVAQGFYQFQYWTGITPLYENARVSLSCATIVRRLDANFV
jgi:pentafunctional AROM polypeptide